MSFSGRLLVKFLMCAAAVSAIPGCLPPRGPETLVPEDDPAWKLIFADEFEGEALDRESWDTGYPWGRYLGGSEVAYYTDEGNLSLGDGHARMTARREHYNGFCFDWDEEGNFTPYYKEFDYTSGMLYGRKPFRYGYFECRFRVPRGKGFNAAFWLYGEKSCEIDVFEILGGDPTDAQMTLHWKERDPLVGTRQWPKHTRRTCPPFDGGWHTFGVLWEPDRLEWYLDGTRVPQSPWTRFIRGRHVPDVDMHVILTLGVGGMDGDPDGSTPFPSHFDVDHVRVYGRAGAEFGNERKGM